MRIGEAHYRAGAYTEAVAILAGLPENWRPPLVGRDAR